MNPLWVLAVPVRRRRCGAAGSLARRAVAPRGARADLGGLACCSWWSSGSACCATSRRCAPVAGPPLTGCWPSQPPACGRGHSGTVLRWLTGPPPRSTASSGPEPTGGEGEFSMTVLDDIVAGVRQDLAVREQATPLAEVKERARPPRVRDRVRGPAARRGRGPRDRRGEALEPEQGRARHHQGPRRAGGRVREGRRRRHLGAHRGAPVPRLARRPRRGPRPGGHPRAAQGLRRHAVPGVGGPRARRRPRAAHRRRARADRARVAGRARALAGHDRPGRGARRRGGRPAPPTRAPA